MYRNAGARLWKILAAACLLGAITCVTALAVPSPEQPCTAAQRGAAPADVRELVRGAESHHGKCETLLADLSRSRQL